MFLRAMQGQMREQKLGQKITRVQEACRKKLDEVHEAYRQASGRQDKLPVAFTSWSTTACHVGVCRSE